MRNDETLIKKLLAVSGKTATRRKYRRRRKTRMAIAKVLVLHANAVMYT